MRGNIKEELLFIVHFPQKKRKEKKIENQGKKVCLVENYNDSFLITLWNLTLRSRYRWRQINSWFIPLVHHAYIYLSIDGRLHGLSESSITSFLSIKLMIIIDKSFNIHVVIHLSFSMYRISLFYWHFPRLNPHVFWHNKPDWFSYLE